MAAHQPIPQYSNQGLPPWRDRLWRYAPLLAWMAVIFLASTGALSATNSGSVIEPLLHWFFPNITDTGVAVIHSVVRKGGHLTEYAILALLAARAFSGSAHEGLRRRWFAAALGLVVLYSFSDEFHQSFVASRTASVFDCMIDIAGGLAALVFYSRRHVRAPDKVKQR
ncbi:MAG: VanZ family protein [Pyrinomonadaceae bacterium]